MFLFRTEIHQAVLSEIYFKAEFIIFKAKMNYQVNRVEITQNV